MSEHEFSSDEEEDDLDEGQFVSPPSRQHRQPDTPDPSRLRAIEELQRRFRQNLGISSDQQSSGSSAASTSRPTSQSYPSAYELPAIQLGELEPAHRQRSGGILDRPPRPFGSTSSRPPPRPVGNDPLPSIVEKYKKKDTGSPDLDLMRRDTPQTKFKKSKHVGRSLAGKSLLEVQSIHDWKSKRKDRKKQVLRDRDYKKRRSDMRWHSAYDVRPPTEVSRLQPSRSADSGLNEQRFERPLSEMKRPHQTSRIMPVGPLGYGRLDRPRSRSVDDLRFRDVGGLEGEDPQHWSNRERAFAERLHDLPPADFGTYSTYRDSVDPRTTSPYVRNRMTGAPTPGRLMGLDKSEAQEAVTRSKSVRGYRKERRKSVGDRASLPGPAPIKKKLKERKFVEKWKQRYYTKKEEEEKAARDAAFSSSDSEDETEDKSKGKGKGKKKRSGCDPS